MTDLKQPTKKQVLEAALEAAKDCPQAERALKELFPEAFEEKWEDVTDRLTSSIGDGFVNISYKSDLILTTEGKETRIYIGDIKLWGWDFHLENYRITIENGKIKVLKKAR